MRKVLKYGLLLISVIFFSNLSAQKFSNKGKEFWVGYGHNQLFFDRNQQDMLLYISADERARVKVSINGTSWFKEYDIPAGSVKITDLFPKDGDANDARLMKEGLSDKGIHIESDVPVVVYTHVYGVYSSGASMLLPVESYGYTYYSSNVFQDMDADIYSWAYVVANEDNTKVTITPIRETSGGRPAGEPFDVVLKRGQIYNVMCTLDFSGTKIQSVPGSDGKCHPIAVFSGSSRAYVCKPEIFQGGQDFMMQQAFPVSAWGNHYVTASTSSSLSPSILNNNRFRVYVKDPTTKVLRNGIRIPGSLIQRSFYEFESNLADDITADKPVMVSQLIPSQSACGTTGVGDPEMIFLSPVEQAINQVTFYSTDKELILCNYVTIVLPKAGLSSLKIDGSNSFDYTYPHPNAAGYEVVVKKLPVTAMQHTASSDIGFTGIVYGLGEKESYGYNAGAYVNNLSVIPEILFPDNQYPVKRICPGTPFKLSITTFYQPTTIIIDFSKAVGINPSKNIVITNPLPSGTRVINGKTYYDFEVPGEYSISKAGESSVLVSVISPEIDNCSQSELLEIKIPVEQGPIADFNALPVCIGESSKFETISGDPLVDVFKWSLPDGTTFNTRDMNYKYADAGDKKVRLEVMRSSDGCKGDTTKTITINQLPVADFSVPEAVCMPEGKVIFKDLSTVSGKNNPVFKYDWQFEDGGNAISKEAEHTYHAAGIFKVTLKVTTQEGCSNTATKEVSNFINIPDVHFDITDASLCQGDTAFFTDNSSLGANRAIAKWRWDFGDNSFSSLEHPSRLYTRAGEFTVNLTVSVNGCAGTDENKIKIFALPYVNAGPDKVTDVSKGIILSGEKGANVAIEWTPFLYLSDNKMVNPKATPPATQTYYITGTGENNCVSSDSMVVKIFKELKIPNAFTPNGDGVNDLWTIPGLSMYENARVEIFGRWGEVIYRSTGYLRPWDGRYKGKDLPIGTYYYVINTGTATYGVLKGVILLLR